MSRKQRRRAEIRRKQREYREQHTITAIVVKDRQWTETTAAELIERVERKEIKATWARGERGE